ncbi:RimJ/RimL family protein N-acetyltransferase [Streptomyces sp. DSM 40167]|uniref:GNAT family N-acetyltransferase n=1 Tax=Streptomyces sp. DSM 40167 TaxID=2817708 RepID=UPI002789AF59|nr:RimJ/RimL family protein N-acetyltransferase [Streptomyces sp. DSM 40167]
MTCLDAGGRAWFGGVALRGFGFGFDDGVANVSYWVLPDARGRGVATSAVAAVSAWALVVVGFHRLYLEHARRNHASCAVATKSGYPLEGTQRSAAVHDDGRQDMHLHARIQGVRTT